MEHARIVLHKIKRRGVERGLTFALTDARSVPEARGAQRSENSRIFWLSIQTHGGWIWNWQERRTRSGRIAATTMRPAKTWRKVRANACTSILGCLWREQLDYRKTWPKMEPWSKVDVLPYIDWSIYLFRFAIPSSGHLNQMRMEYICLSVYMEGVFGFLGNLSEYLEMLGLTFSSASVYFIWLNVFKNSWNVCQFLQNFHENTANFSPKNVIILIISSKFH